MKLAPSAAQLWTLRSKSSHHTLRPTGSRSLCIGSPVPAPEVWLLPATGTWRVVPLSQSPKRGCDHPDSVAPCAPGAVCSRELMVSGELSAPSSGLHPGGVVGWSFGSCRIWGFSSAQWFLKLIQTPRGVGWAQGRLSEDQGDDYRGPALADCSPGLVGIVPGISGVWACHEPEGGQCEEPDGIGGMCERVFPSSVLRRP